MQDQCCSLQETGRNAESRTLDLISRNTALEQGNIGSEGRCEPGLPQGPVQMPTIH